MRFPVTAINPLVTNDFNFSGINVRFNTFICPARNSLALLSTGEPPSGSNYLAEQYRPGLLPAVHHFFVIERNIKIDIRIVNHTV